MNRNHAVAVVTLAGAGVLILAGFGEAARTRQTEQAKRRTIHEEVLLDLTAIERARDVVLQKLDDGKIQSLGALQDNVDQEIAFQKIAIREDSF